VVDGAATPMTNPLARATLFALYQLTILVGIVLLPVSLLTRRFGLTLPAGQLVETLGETYETVS
jgi:hypothetical protein